jgi:hypothetical protein
VRREQALVAAICAILIASVVINLALFLTARSGVDIVWSHDARFLRAEQGHDSWQAMEMARAYARTHSNDLYEQLFFVDAVKFQYPPTALLLFGNLERPALNLISWIATLIAACLVAAILRKAIAIDWNDDVRQTAAAALALDGLVVLAALTFYPFIKAYSLGQIQMWLNVLFATVVLAWMIGAPGVAGAALGLMCLVKPTYALLFLWGALRREWRFVAAGAVVIGVGLAVSLWRYGVHDHLEYLRVLSYIARRGEAFYANQSINGVLNRALFNGSNLKWQNHEFAPQHPMVYVGTMVAFVALMWVSLRRTEPGAGRVIDFSIAALAVTLTAPVAWEHHYGILLPIYAAVTPFVIVRRPLGRWTVVGMVLSFLVAANYVQFTNHFADTWLNPLQSYLLAAALFVWLVIYRAAHLRLEAPVSVVGRRTDVRLRE